MGTIGFPKTSVRNYYSMPHKIPKEHRSHRTVSASHTMKGNSLE